MVIVTEITLKHSYFAPIISVQILTLCYFAEAAHCQRCLYAPRWSVGSPLANQFSTFLTLSKTKINSENLFFQLQ